MFVLPNKKLVKYFRSLHFYYPSYFFNKKIVIGQYSKHKQTVLQDFSLLRMHRLQLFLFGYLKDQYFLKMHIFQKHLCF